MNRVAITCEIRSLRWQFTIEAIAVVAQIVLSLVTLQQISQAEEKQPLIERPTTALPLVAPTDSTIAGMTRPEPNTIGGRAVTKMESQSSTRTFSCFELTTAKASVFCWERTDQLRWPIPFRPCNRHSKGFSKWDIITS